MLTYSQFRLCFVATWKWFWFWCILLQIWTHEVATYYVARKIYISIWMKFFHRNLTSTVQAEVFSILLTGPSLWSILFHCVLGRGAPLPPILRLYRSILYTNGWHLSVLNKTKIKCCSGLVCSCCRGHGQGRHGVMFRSSAAMNGPQKPAWLRLFISLWATYTLGRMYLIYSLKRVKFICMGNMKQFCYMLTKRNIFWHFLVRVNPAYIGWCHWR